MTTLPRHESGGLTTFPDEVLFQVLKHFDLCTKLEAHTVCRQWNSVLSEPCCADLWTSVPEDRFSAETLPNPRKQDLERYVNWLADRAAGIPRISFSTGQWTPVWQSTSNITEARFFIERQLPYLLGYLHCQNKHININTSTDADIMSCPLLSDQLLLSCLSQNLVELHMTVHSDDNSQLNFDMDCLSGMSKLQQMHINSMGDTRTWTTQGLLSSLTALESFTFLNDSMMVGALMTALGSLPKLTALTTSHIPGGRIEPDSTHFTALKRLVMKYSERDASNLHIAIGPSLSSLCKLSLSDCHVVSTPVPFKYLSSLTKVSFDDCEFVPDESVWLSEALEGATQIQSLVDSTLTHDIPNSVCQMVGLKQLRIQYTLLSDLPAEFAQLRHLEDLDLRYNKLSRFPTVLKQITYLRNINLTFASDTMQLTQPLTFLSAFANLESLYLTSPPNAWSRVSSFHIGQLQAVLKKTFKNRLPKNKPSFSYSL